MNQIVIVTPLGEVCSAVTDSTNDDLLDYLKTATESPNMDIELEDGSIYFMTKAMADTSAFFIKPFQSNQ
jgi:hypothetical protein